MSEQPFRLRCPKCHDVMVGLRHILDPPDATVMEIICPKCDDGDFHSPRYFRCDGTEIMEPLAMSDTKDRKLLADEYPTNNPYSSAKQDILNLPMNELWWHQQAALRAIAKARQHERERVAAHVQRLKSIREQVLKRSPEDCDDGWDDGIEAYNRVIACIARGKGTSE